MHSIRQQQQQNLVSFWQSHIRENEAFRFYHKRIIVNCNEQNPTANNHFTVANDKVWFVHTIIIKSSVVCTLNLTYGAVIFRHSFHFSDFFCLQITPSLTLPNRLNITSMKYLFYWSTVGKIKHQTIYLYFIICLFIRLERVVSAWSNYFKRELF